MTSKWVIQNILQLSEKWILLQQHSHSNKCSPDLPSLTVLPWDSRFWPKSRSLDHRYFRVFENKNNPNWSLIVLLIQIRKFQITAWVFLGSLPCTGCWFPSIILKLVIFRVHQKEKIACLVSLCNYRNLSKKLHLEQTQKAISEDV